MAEGLISTADLVGFQNNLAQTNPYGIAGQALAGYSPDTRTWSPMAQGVSSFAKAFAAGLLSNYAKQDTANQLNSVISVLPQLRADPFSVSAPAGVDESAFLPIKTSAILKGYEQQAVKEEAKKTRIADLVKATIGPMIASGQMDLNTAIPVITSDDPAAAYAALPNKTGENVELPKYTALLDQLGITDPKARASVRNDQMLQLLALHGTGAAQDRLDAAKAKSDTQLENRLRTELERTNSPHQVAVSVAPLLVAAQDNAAKTAHSPIDDLALVDTYNKIMNPGGVLRAQLVEQVKEAQNPLHKLAGQIEYVTNGGTFDETGRQQLIESLMSVGNEKIRAGKSFADNKLAIAKNKMGEEASANILDPGYYQNIYGGQTAGAIKSKGSQPSPSSYSNPQDYLAAYRVWEAQSAK